MTKKENFVAIKSALNEVGISAFDEFIDHEVALLARKRSTSGKPTKNQVANEAIKENILAVLSESDTRLRASDVVKLMNEEYSLPKISALLKQLVDAGMVAKVTEKKVSYFSVA